MFGFVYKNDKQGIIYDGDVKKVDYAIDQLEAMTWWKSKPDNVKIKTHSILVYGKETKINLPTFTEFDKDNFIDVTEQFTKYIFAQARYKMLADKALGIWQQILKQFSVYRLGTFVGFYPIEGGQKNKSYKDRYQGKDKAALIMLKELLDGDIRLEPYILDYKGEQKEIQIGQNYKVNLFNKEVFIPGNYSNSLRWAMFSKNIQSKRDDLNLTGLLQAWQYDVILNMGKYTYFTIPRRGGKTFLLAHIAFKEMLKNKYSIQSRFRPITILYVGLTADRNYAVIQYIKYMLKEMGKGGNIMFRWHADTKSYEFRSGTEVIASIKFIAVKDFEPGYGDYADLVVIDEAHKIPWKLVDGILPIVQNEGARLIAASTLYEDLPKNWFYDKLVEGEANVFNIESMIENMYNEHEDLIKRLYDGTYTEEDKADFYLMNVKWHNKIGTVGMRFTYDDIEYIPDWIKEKVKKEVFETNPRKFLISFYNRFPDEGKVFDYETSLKREDVVKNAPYQYIVIAYDPALTRDYSAVMVLGYNPFSKTIALLEEHSLKKTGRYEDQVDEIKKIQKEASKYVYESAKKSVYSFFVMDGTQKATAEILMMKGVRIDCRVSYTSGNKIKTLTGLSGEHLVPKKYLVELLGEMLDGRKVVINRELKKVINEMGNFKMKMMATGYVKYEADSSKSDEEGMVINDDFINAAMLGNYFICNVLGLKYKMFSKDPLGIDPKAVEMTRQELAKYHKEIITNERKRKELEKKKFVESQYYSTFIY